MPEAESIARNEVPLENLSGRGRCSEDCDPTLGLTCYEAASGANVVCYERKSLGYVSIDGILPGECSHSTLR